MVIFKIQQIIISTFAVCSHGLVYRSLKLDNSISRTALRSPHLLKSFFPSILSIQFERIKLFNSRKRINNHEGTGWFSKYNKSLYRLLQSVLTDWWIVHLNLTIRFSNCITLSTLTQVLLSLFSISSIWKNKLFNPSERITYQSVRNSNPWEWIPDSREGIIRFEKTTFWGVFFVLKSPFLFSFHTSGNN